MFMGQLVRRVLPLAPLLVACGNAPPVQPYFGPAPDAGTRHDAHHDGATHKTTPDAGTTEPPGTCGPPDSGAFDSGVHFTGLVTAVSGAYPSGGGFYATFSTTPFNSLNCVGAEVPLGSCCVGMDTVTTSLDGNPTTGSVTLTQGGETLVQIFPTYGLYSRLGFGSWTPGEELGVSSGGGGFPSFALQVNAPGAVTAASAQQTDAGLAVTWTPAPDATVAQIYVFQVEGDETCTAPVMQGIFTVNATAPLWIGCNVDSSLGAFTVPSSLFAEASFSIVEGMSALNVMVAAANVAETLVSGGGFDDRVIVLATSLGIDAGTVAVSP